VKQELSQADISVLKKAALNDRLQTMRKAFDKVIKERQAAAGKKALEDFAQYFVENPSSQVYVANLEVDGNAKLLQGVATQAKKAEKALYVFSVDSEQGKVAHVNYVSPALKKAGVDARTWAAKVTDLIGGKAGGKEESAQGVGSEVACVEEAIKAAKQHVEAFL
jgi:alanyl-tRNA synthetase